MYTSDSDVLYSTAGLAVLGIIFIVAIIIALVVYLLTAIPLFKIAKNAGKTNAWLAWIPIANYYLFNDLSDGPYDMFNGTIHFENRANAFWLYLGLALGGAILGNIPILGSLIKFCCFIAEVIVFYGMVRDFLNLYNPNSDNTVLAVFSAIVNIVFIVVLWMNSNKTPVYGNTFDTTYQDTTDYYNNNSYNNNDSYNTTDSYNTADSYNNSDSNNDNYNNF